MLLLPTSYLAPISYHADFFNTGKAEIELYEHFPKQTWRNRCSIYSPNGMQQLIIPLDGRKDRSLTKDIRINYENKWQLNHWRSLEAAYRSSPYFEYYEDDLREFFETRFEYLFELNTQLQNKILGLLEQKCELSFTSSYEKDPIGKTDLRQTLSKKYLSTKNNYPRYQQVFEERNGFLSNLSVVDLLFNLGPKAQDYFNGLK